MKLLCFFSLILLPFYGLAQSSHRAAAEAEIIYGRKDGMALTMIKHQPTAAPNGKAIVWVVSGYWFSSYNNRPGKDRLKALLNRGYTVFEVMHGSQPRYNVEEALADLQRAVRYIRHHASEYGIDPNRLGISGASAGGHLSLLLALKEDEGLAAAPDPVNRQAAKVKAVAVFYPPTDFTNYGGLKDPILYPALLAQQNILGAFDFRIWDSTKRYYVSLRDKELLRQKSKDVSPAWQATPNDPPVFIYHGDADRIVPLQQSQVLVEKLKAVNVPVELKIKAGADHGWRGQWEELNLFADWFDKYLN